MSKISVLRSNFDGTNWKRIFAGHLSRLLPDMNPDAADEVSDTEVLRSKNVEPELAAKRWVARRELASSESAPDAKAG